MDARFIKTSLGRPGPSDGRIYGKLGSVSLNDILQLLGMAHRTATVRLQDRGQEGKIYFREGVLLHAIAGSASGEKALLKLINWDSAEFVVEDGIEGDPPATISKNVDAAMLNLLTRLDEGWVPEMTPFPQLDRPTASPAVLERRASPVSRKRPPPPRPKASAKARVASVAAAVVVLGAASGVALFLSGTSLEPPPPVANVVAAAGAPVPPSRGIAGDILQAAMNRQLLDAATVLVGHGVALSAAVGSNEEPAEPAAGPSPGPAAEPVPRAVGSGHLLVVVDPWALVAIDGADVGETPLTEIPLDAGSHDVVLSNPNVVGVIRDRVTVVAGQTIRKRYSFHDSGSLRVLVKPWADVYVDGRHVGQTPMGELHLPPGRHILLFRHPQLGEKTEQVEILANREKVVEVQM
jgi:Domain of unknown function (DUF4388)/PEGA domain